MLAQAPEAGTGGATAKAHWLSETKQEEAKLPVALRNAGWMSTSFSQLSFEIIQLSVSMNQLVFDLC